MLEGHQGRSELLRTARSNHHGRDPRLGEQPRERERRRVDAAPLGELRKPVEGSEGLGWRRCS